MSRSRRRIVCSCGESLPDPPPKICPACDAEIVGFRRIVWRPIVSTLILIALLAACAAYGWWLIS